MSDNDKLKRDTKCRDCGKPITPEQYRKYGLCESCVQKQDIKRI